MDINALKKYIANKSPKKPLTESPEYVVVKTMTIPHSETITGIAGTVKTVVNPKGGQIAVLLKFRDGFIAAGTGKTQDDAIQNAVHYRADTLNLKANLGTK